MPHHQSLPARSITDNLFLPHQLQGNGNSATIIITQSGNNQAISTKAGETIIYGQPCHVADNGRAYLSSRDDNPAMFIAISSGDSGDDVMLIKHGIINYQHNHQPGTMLYLGINNLIDSIKLGKIYQQLATAIDHNTIIVNIHPPEYYC